MANYKILVVDDDEPLRSAIRSYMEVKGYSVAEANTGKACREFLELQRPDAAVDGVAELLGVAVADLERVFPRHGG